MLFADGLGDLLGGLLGGGGGGGLTQLVMIVLLAWMALKGKSPVNPLPTPTPVPSPAPTPAPTPDVGPAPDGRVLVKLLTDLLTRLKPAGLDGLAAGLASPDDASDPTRELSGKVAAGFREIHEEITALASAAPDQPPDASRLQAVLNRLVSYWPLVELLLKLKGIPVPNIPFRPVQLAKIVSTVRLSDGLSAEEIALLRGLLSTRNAQAPEVPLAA